MKPTNTKWYTIAAICFILAVLVITARSADTQTTAGPATNQVTLTWTAPFTNYVPYVYEVQMTTSMNTNNQPWSTIAQNIPSNVTFLTITVDKEQKYFRVRSVNSTNASWTSDFSNVAQTLWPGQGGNLAIRLGP